MTDKHTPDLQAFGRATNQPASGQPRQVLYLHHRTVNSQRGQQVRSSLCPDPLGARSNAPHSVPSEPTAHRQLFPSITALPAWTRCRALHYRLGMQELVLQTATLDTISDNKS